MTLPVVRLIGAPTDCHSSYLRGAASAPAAIRAALASDHSNAAAESGVEIGVDVRLDDTGDLPFADRLAATTADDALLFDAVAAAAANGAMPLVLGGDHSISVPVVAALAAAHGPLNILHIDDHPDIYDDFEGDPRSHASPFARILEAGGLSVRDVLAVLTRQTAPLVGADIVELFPPRDPTGVTAILAAKLVRELAALDVRNGGTT